MVLRHTDKLLSLAYGKKKISIEGKKEMKHIIAGNAQNMWPKSGRVDSFGMWHERYFLLCYCWRCVSLERRTRSVRFLLCKWNLSMLPPLFLSGRWPGEWPGLLWLLFSFDGVENALGVLGVLITIKVIMESSMYRKVLCPTACFVCVSPIAGQYAVLFNSIREIGQNLVE